jgi:hypothetical protein
MKDGSYARQLAHGHASLAMTESLSTSVPFRPQRWLFGFETTDAQSYDLLPLPTDTQVDESTHGIEAGVGPGVGDELGEGVGPGVGDGVGEVVGPGVGADEGARLLVGL